MPITTARKPAALPRGTKLLPQGCVAFPINLLEQHPAAKAALAEHYRAKADAKRAPALQAAAVKRAALAARDDHEPGLTAAVKKALAVSTPAATKALIETIRAARAADVTDARPEDRIRFDAAIVAGLGLTLEHAARLLDYLHRGAGRNAVGEAISELIAGPTPRNVDRVAFALHVASRLVNIGGGSFAPTPFDGTPPDHDAIDRELRAVLASADFNVDPVHAPHLARALGITSDAPPRPALRVGGFAAIER